jgi:hypothetical protein
LEIEQDKVVVRKGDCGLPGSKVCVTNRIAATQSLLSKFLGSFHLQSKNAAGENVQKLKHIQDEFVSNLEVMKKFKERFHQYDMRTPLQVPAVYRNIVGEDAWDAQGDASNPYRKIVDLTLHWGKLPLEHILKWQRDFNGYSSGVDHVSSIWIKDISYFKIVVDTVFKMSSMTEESLKSLINNLSAKSVLAGEKLVATYSISTLE